MMRDCFGGFCFLKTADFLIIAYLRRMGNKKTASLRMKAHSFCVGKPNARKAAFPYERQWIESRTWFFFLLIHYFNVPMISAQALQAGQSQKRAPFSLMSFA